MNSNLLAMKFVKWYNLLVIMIVLGISMYDILDKRYSRQQLLNEGKEVSFKMESDPITVTYKDYPVYRSIFRSDEKKPERNKDIED